MHRIAFWVFVVALAGAPLSHARADEQTKDQSAPAAANTVAAEPDKPSSAPAPKTADETKKPSSSTEAGIKDHVDKFKKRNAGNPYTDKIATSAEDLAKTLNDDQAHAFAQIRDGASILRTVRLTVGEVGGAVATCGKNNPGLKKGMDDRFEGWKQDVDAALDKNEKSMQADVNAGVAGEPKKVRNYLKLVDQWNAYNESKLEKTPATTEGACKSLQESMDSSGKAIVTQLESLKWPATPQKPTDEPANKSGEKSGQSQEQTEPAAGKAP